MNALTGAIVWILLLLSILLTAAVLFPGISATAIVAVLGGGSAIGLVGGLVLLARRPKGPRPRWTAQQRREWRMPPITLLEPPRVPRASKIWLVAMRGYLALAVVLVIVKVVVVALGR